MADSRMVREFGHAVAGGWDRTREDNWQLRFPQSVAIYAKMMRQDAQVVSILKALTLPVRRATWRINANGAPDEIVRRVAGDLRLPILGDESEQPQGRRAGRVSWTSHLQKVLLALPYGFMFFEQVYAVDAEGHEHLVKLAPRLPGTITKINVADDGGLDSIEQTALPGKTDHPTIPVGRLVAYVYEPTDTSWTGTSVLRPMYKHWQLRDDYLQLEYNALERNGMGVPIYTTREDSPEPQTELDQGQAIAENLRSGESAGAAIPGGAKLEIKGTQGQLASPRQAIEYHDAMMAKSVLAHFLNLDSGGGSYALADTQADFFVQTLQTIADWVADTANQHIVEDLVDVAFPSYEGPCPLIFCDPIASKKELTAEALSILVNSGVILPDRPLEDDVRRRWQLPDKPLPPLSQAEIEQRIQEKEQQNDSA